MWKISDEQAVVLMNRVNDIWEIDTDPDNHLEFVASTQRLLGAINMMFNADNYVSKGGEKC